MPTCKAHLISIFVARSTKTVFISLLVTVQDYKRVGMGGLVFTIH